MRINSLTLKDFRGFTEYQLDLAARFNLLIGDNGSGKTALLDALSVALGAYFLGIPDQPSLNLAKEDIRNEELVVGQTTTREKAGEAIVTAFGVVDDHEIRWVRSLLGDGRTTRKWAKEIEIIANKMAQQIKTPEGSNVVLPVIAYYGTGRLWAFLRDMERRTQKPGSRFLGYQGCLDPKSDQKTFFRWFKTHELAALQKQERRHTLEAVREAIVRMIPGASRIYWDIEFDEPRLEMNISGIAQTIPFHFLSDGYRNMVGIVADLAFRMATLNPQLGEQAIWNTPGVVLIDEIDLHLHPNWQRVVVRHLMEAFPMVQFVATTHSPFIIQSLYQEPEVGLWDVAKQERLGLDTKSIEDIAEDMQGVAMPQQSQRFLDMMASAEAYYAALKSDQPHDEAGLNNLRMRLDELSAPFSDDPAFQAFLKMERTKSEISSEGQNS